MKTLISMIFLVFLSACSLFPARVVVKQTYIWPPDVLLQSCHKPKLRARLVEDVIKGYLDLSKAYDICASQIESIQELKRKLGE